MIWSYRSDFKREVLNTGDLVQLFAYSPHDAELARTPLHNGIYIDYDEYEDGWQVLVEGKLETYAKTWWKIKKVDWIREISL
jgi:hypothetical protein